MVWKAVHCPCVPFSRPPTNKTVCYKFRWTSEKIHLLSLAHAELIDMKYYSPAPGTYNPGPCVLWSITLKCWVWIKSHVLGVKKHVSLQVGFEPNCCDFRWVILASLGLSFLFCKEVMISSFLHMHSPGGNVNPRAFRYIQSSYNLNGNWSHVYVEKKLWTFVSEQTKLTKVIQQ